MGLGGLVHAAQALAVCARGGVKVGKDLGRGLVLSHGAGRDALHHELVHGRERLRRRKEHSRLAQRQVLCVILRARVAHGGAHVAHEVQVLHPHREHERQGSCRVGALAHGPTVLHVTRVAALDVHAVR